MFKFLKDASTYRQRLSAFGDRYRIWLYGIALSVFLGGFYLSITALKLDIKDMAFGPLLVVLCITHPLLILLNSLELKLCAVASNSKLSFLDCLFVSNSATVANILPVPAGLVLRGAALVKSGGRLKTVSEVLLIAALMWIVIATLISGSFIAEGQYAWLVLSLGAITVMGLIIYTQRISTYSIAFGFLMVRLLMVILLTIQLKLCFAVFGAAVDISDAAIYVVSGIAGAVISIVPAGLGIIEGFGALLAKIDGNASSAQAYIVLSLNRLIGLGLAAISVVIFGCFQKRYVFKRGYK